MNFLSLKRIYHPQKSIHFVSWRYFYWIIVLLVLNVFVSPFLPVFGVGFVGVDIRHQCVVSLMSTALEGVVRSSSCYQLRDRWGHHVQRAVEATERGAGEHQAQGETHPPRS